MSERRELIEMTYDERMTELDEILTRLDDSETPIDQLASVIKRGMALILSL